MMADQPNILVIVVDSLRADRVGCYGYDRDTTPTIDRLASQGCLFASAITAAPFSPASYASIFSNLYPHQHGVNGDTVRVWPDGWPRLPERLKECGYYTFCISNNAFVTRAMNTGRGFDDLLDMREPTWYVRQHERVLRRVRRHFGDDWARRLSSNRMNCFVKGDSHESMRNTAALINASRAPFFGFVILMDPHTPYDRRRTRYAASAADVRRFFRRYNKRTMWAEMMADGRRLTAAELAVVRDLYDAETRHADDCIRTLVEQLRAQNRLDNTVLIVTADHGEAFGEQGTWGHGFCLNDCLTRVPLIIRCPRYWPAATRFPGLVQLHDIHDLAMSLAADGRPRIDSHPYCLTQAADPDWQARDAVFSEFPRQSRTIQFMRERNPAFNPGRWDHDMWAVRTADWRCVQYDNGEIALYDLQNDPAERTDVHQNYPDVLDTLIARLEAHRSDRPFVDEAGPKEDVDEAVAERLRALGYIE